MGEEGEGGCGRVGEEGEGGCGRVGAGGGGWVREGEGG